MAINSILLIISGSVAAYKSLELIRLFRKSGVTVDAILTKGGQEFITPLAVSSLSGNETYTDLFSLKDEVEMGHIQLSRKADAILVAPASADIIAKMATGQCNDLATTTLLATDKPVYIAPAMNHRMWENAATQRNIVQLQADGITLIEPTAGEMACGEHGMGRFAELETILSAATGGKTQSLALRNKKVLVTAGPTHEPIDPVRYLGNRSSGKQGIAIAEALAAQGAEVHLVLGPTHEKPSHTITTYPVQTAQEMFDQCQNLLPADIAICTAAVADWKVEGSNHKIKKKSGESPNISLSENPDILKWLSQEATQRPELVIGFAAETESLEANANAKLAKKGCDWLLANDVSEGKVFGKDKTQILLLPEDENWHGSKREIALKLVDKITNHFNQSKKQESA
ncbi:MAG: bifunctional phosphopantothenoylcysteine decarboxylase/phosphopantothenate--cysteine ligase CoaBC [Rickettsiales bacterium]|nr:bifunctional phosphopantothenoylcysteine decarboxylase/phosphopantothenate--cysteine ligase CoaBC [Rickettsiales bacterium]